MDVGKRLVDQPRLLFEIANTIIRIREEKLISIKTVTKHKECDICVPERLTFLRNIITDLKYDPIDAYKRIVREIRHIEIKLKKMKRPVVAENKDVYNLLYPGEEFSEEPFEQTEFSDAPLYGENCSECMEHYRNNSLLRIKEILDTCRMVRMYLVMKERGELKEKTGDRSFYRKIMHPTTKPNFTSPKPSQRPFEKNHTAPRNKGMIMAPIKLLCQVTTNQCLFKNQ